MHRVQAAAKPDEIARLALFLGLGDSDDFTGSTFTRDWRFDP